MGQPENLVAEIQEYCRTHYNPKGSEKYARYFKEGFDAWGLLDRDHPVFNEKQQEWFARYRPMGPRGFFKAGHLLFASGKYEEGSLAIRFIKEFLDQLDESAIEGLSGWFRAGIRNWAHVDILSGEIIQPLLVGGKIKLTVLAGWRESDLRFQRRAVPVSMIGLLKTDAKIPALLRFIRPMMLDQERVVHQGLGWFLREAWKKQPAELEAFLLGFKDTAARLIFQYATEKMTAAGRARFRRAKN